MANTEYEHAGNADQLRQMQQDAAARCELCHYLDGSTVSDTTITLEPVNLPNDRVALFCQLCVQLCKQVGDEGYENASKMIRPLPPENAAANEKLLAEILAEAEKADVEDLTHY